MRARFPKWPRSVGDVDETPGNLKETAGEGDELFSNLKETIGSVDQTLSRMREDVGVDPSGERVHAQGEAGPVPLQSGEGPRVESKVASKDAEEAQPGAALRPPAQQRKELDPRRENAELRVRLAALEGELAAHRQRETVIAEALLDARTTANELRERAEREAEALRREAQAEVEAQRREAEQQREALMGQAKAEADELLRRAEADKAEISAEIERLRELQAEIEQAVVRSLLLKLLEVLKGSQAGDREADQLSTDSLSARASGIDQVLADAVKDRSSDAAETPPQVESILRDEPQHS